MLRRTTTGTARRRGTSLIEMAFVLPVFLIFLFALVEFSHAYLVINILNAATKRAARQGVAEGVSTATVEQRVRDILGSAIHTTNVTVQVKDAGNFDGSNLDPKNVNYSALPAIELSNASERQLFIVRASVRYDDVALMPPFWVKNLVLSGQSVMRHE